MDCFMTGTSVLSRRFRVEEDLDDGTYTRVSKLQIESVWKRLNIIDEDEKTAECERIHEVWSRMVLSPVRNPSPAAPAQNVCGVWVCACATPLFCAHLHDSIHQTQVLKGRIRDLKRIFQFYCASNETGSSTSMDHAECVLLALSVVALSHAKQQAPIV